VTRTALRNPLRHREGEYEIKFETYRFYLKCIVDFLRDEYNEWESFGEKAIERSQGLKRFSNPDQGYLNRFLKNAWNTEYIASNARFIDIDSVKINNQWKPIQVYYAIYTAGEALSYLVDGEKADSHRKCLRKLSDFLEKRRLPPWSFAFKGPCGKRRNEHYPVGFPRALSIPHNLRRQGVKPVEMIAKCLKAEHAHRFDEDFRKEKGRFKYKFDPGRTTILHFLYRLRIKSNYRDAEIFLADAPESDIKEFSENLSEFCFWTMLLFEVFIIRRCGYDCFADLLREYKSKNKDAKQLQKRLAFYEENSRQIAQRGS